MKEENEPDLSCSICDGSGYVGPKNDPNTPIELMKVGCCICSSCNGTGKTQRFVSDELDAALWRSLKESATKIAKGRKAIKEKFVENLTPVTTKIVSNMNVLFDGEGAPIGEMVTTEIANITVKALNENADLKNQIKDNAIMHVREIDKLRKMNSKLELSLSKV